MCSCIGILCVRLAAARAVRDRAPFANKFSSIGFLFAKYLSGSLVFAGQLAWKTTMVSYSQFAWPKN
jgi:hypothetical protein